MIIHVPFVGLQVIVKDFSSHKRDSIVPTGCSLLRKVLGLWFSLFLTVLSLMQLLSVAAETVSFTHIQSDKLLMRKGERI